MKVAGFVLAIVTYWICQCALAQFTYVPGTKLVILRADPPLPDRTVVEAALRTFANHEHFMEGLPPGRRSVAFGRDPDLSLIGTFTSRYINVLLWSDPDDRELHRSEVTNLVETLRPLGFRELAALPDDPD